MKVLAAFLLLLVPVYVSADITVVEGRITADIYSQSLGEIVQKIERDGNIQISMEEGIANQTVSASFKDLPVALAIKKLLEGTGINYAVVSIGQEPPVIFIGKREAPGASARVLDSRPVNRQPRGLVSPVTPNYVPPPQPDGTVPLEKQGSNPLTAPNPKSANPSPPANIPTGGGYIPGGNTPQPVEQPVEQNQPSEEEPETEEQ